MSLIASFVFIDERSYKLPKRILAKRKNCQTDSGLIIEEELKPFLKRARLASLALAPNLGLHTLRVGFKNIGGIYVDVGIHMEKESLMAIELKGGDKPFVIKFREDVPLDREIPVVNTSSMGLVDFEREFSQEARRSLQGILSHAEFKEVVTAYPSLYLEDWFNIDYKDSSLVFRVERGGLLGISIGNGTKQKDDVFSWIYGADDKIRRYYPAGGFSSGDYTNFFRGRVKVRGVERAED